MGTSLRRLATLALAVGLTVALGACSDSARTTASTMPASCSTSWGSLPKSHLVAMYTTATVENLRAATDDCFDRLVVDLGPRQIGFPGPQDEGYQARYVPEARSSGTGDRLPIEGGAFLALVVNAAAHDDDYEPTYEPRDPSQAVDVTGFRTFRQVAFLGTFEAQTEIVIGVRAELPFRAFVLVGPDARSQLVIDVAHAGEASTASPSEAR